MTSAPTTSHQHESDRTEKSRRREAVVDAGPAENRRQRHDRERERGRKADRRRRTETGGGLGRVHPGRPKKACGDRGRGRTAAGQDATCRITYKLCRDHGQAVIRAEGDPVELPQADIGQELANERQDGEGPVELRE
jgi:hypothetical protein